MENNIERVSERIGAYVKEFCTTGKEFRMQELTDFVSDKVQSHIAPDSPGRILRMLKKKGEVNYTLVSRSQSLYKVL